MTAAWSPIKSACPCDQRHRRRRPAASTRSLRFRPRFELGEDRTLLSTFDVTNTADSGPGSLRQAILDSNAATAATNTIDFAIPGKRVQTISPLSALPPIIEAVLVDGWSQPGYAGTPLIQIDGSGAGNSDGLTITGSNVTVRGLDIGGFAQGAGIHITGASASRNRIYGNFLGTDPTGTQALSNEEGVEIDAGAVNNTIGGATAGAGNLISANLEYGVHITGDGTTGNLVLGNTIGTDITGTFTLGKNQVGGQVGNGAANNTIGGLTTAAGVFHGFDFASATSPALLTLRGELTGPPQGQTSGGPTVIYRINMEADGELLAIVNPQGFTARLMMLDSHGRVLVQSDAVSARRPSKN
jgi:hypothetical protein